MAKALLPDDLWALISHCYQHIVLPPKAGALALTTAPP